jgi:FkbM family methyltransferase
MQLRTVLYSLVKPIAWRFVNRLVGDRDPFLREVRGIIHVGANLGQERHLYAAYRLNVAWIEPNPDVFDRLSKLIIPYPKQRAFCELIADVDDQEHTFHISNNAGLSSSILELADHKKLWPKISYSKTIRLKSVTLSSLVKREQLDLTKYEALVMDTQGSEMRVLKGGVDILSNFRFIKTEVADFEAYKGCCQLADMEAFLAGRGFREVARKRFGYRVGVGSYYDIVYAGTS